MVEEQEGYVFINESGEFARVITRSGHGGAQHIVGFTRDINQATVFPTDNAYYGLYLGQKERNELITTCQSLKATSKRIVKLGGKKEDKTTVDQ